LADIARRGHLNAAATTAVRDYLHEQALLPLSGRRRVRAALWQQLKRWSEPQPAAAPAQGEAIDYRALVAHWRAAQQKA